MEIYIVRALFHLFLCYSGGSVKYSNVGSTQKIACLRNKIIIGMVQIGAYQSHQIGKKRTSENRSLIISGFNLKRHDFQSPRFKLVIISPIK